MRPASISGAAGQAQQDKSSRGSGASYSGTQQRQSDYAAPLVYANPRSLPSYPSAGLRNDNAAASIAASIGWASQKDRKEEPELSIQKNPSRIQQQQPQQQPQQQQRSKSLRVRAQHVETTNPSAAAGLIGASASSASLKAAAAAASAALSAPLPSRTPTLSQQQQKQQQQVLSPPSPPTGPSLERRKSTQSVRSSRSVRSLRPTPPAVTSTQRSRPLSMFAATPQLSIVVEPPTASIGSTSGSSMAAATAALGSASTRHKRSTSMEASSGRRPPSSPSAKASWGNSAATHAFKNSQSGSSAGTGTGASSGAPELSSQKLVRHPSLHAAQGAMNTAQKPETGTLGIPSTSGMPGTTGIPATRTMRNRAASNPVGGYGHRKSYSSPFPDNSMTTAVGEPATRPVSNASAVSAAALAHNAGNSRAGHKMPEGGAVPYTTMNRLMYTSRPPVAPEAEENDIHASALALAKRMYNVQSQQAAARQATADAETESIEDSDAGEGSGGGAVAPPFTSSLQEAAYRLAQERLEKLHSEYQSNRGYRDHYVDPNLSAKAAAAAAGSSAADSVSGKSRFALRSRLRRRRSASDSVVLDERRQERDMESRQSMPSLSNRITTDLERQRRDRQAVLAAAQRNVAAQLHNIDEQIYAETGRAHPSVLASWESKAHSAAEARVAAGTATGRSHRHNRGSLVIPDTDDNKISLGGGAFMDRSEVNKIAARRVQPILDEINDKAEKEHLRQAALKQEEDDRKQQAELLKTRDREMKDTYHRIKQEEKEEKKAAKEKARTKGTKEAEEVKEPSAADKGKAPLVPIAPAKRSHAENTEAGTTEDLDPDADELMVSAVPATAEGINGTAGKRGSRLSKLFVRTSKIQTHRGEFSTGGVAAAASGGGGKATAEEPSTAASAPSSSAPTSATVASPISPVSEFDDSSPSTSPTSRVRKWLKSRLNRPRSKSTGSAVGVVAMNGNSGHAGHGATTNTVGHGGGNAVSPTHKTVATTEPSVPGTTTAVATTAATTTAAVTTSAGPTTPVKALGERSFIGGHALTSAEGTTGGRSTTATPLSATSPLQMPTPAAAVGAGLLSLPDDIINEAGSSTIAHNGARETLAANEKDETVESEAPSKTATAATAAPPTAGAGTGPAESSFGGFNGISAEDANKRFSHASISSYYSNAGASAADSGFAAAKTHPLEVGGQSSEDALGAKTVAREGDAKSNGATGVSSHATDGADSSVLKNDALAPPPALRDQTKKSASPVRDSRFLENLEEMI